MRFACSPNWPKADRPYSFSIPSHMAREASNDQRNPDAPAQVEVEEPTDIHAETSNVLSLWKPR